MTRTKPLTLEDIKISEDYAMSHPRRRSTRVIYVPHATKEGLSRLEKDLALDNINYENIFIPTHNQDDIKIQVFP